MKKMKTFVFCTLVMSHLIYSSLCSAGDNRIYPINTPVSNKTRLTDVDTRDSVHQIICVDGYKWLVSKTYTGISVSQMMKDSKASYVPQPVKCNE